MSCNDGSNSTPPAQFNLDDHVQGDTWEGITLIGPVTINGAAPALPLASATLTFRRSYSDFEPAYVLTTGTPPQGQGQMTLQSAAEWRLSVPAQPLPLKAATWRWDVTMVDSAGGTYTYVGGLLKVTPRL